MKHTGDPQLAKLIEGKHAGSVNLVQLSASVPAMDNACSSRSRPVRSRKRMLNIQSDIVFLETQSTVRH